MAPPSRKAQSGLLLRAAFANALLALLIGGAFAIELVAVQDLRGSVRAEALSGRALDGANQLEALLLDMETGVRGFVLTRSAQFLQLFDAGRTAFAGEIAALERHEVNARQAARLRAIAPEAAAYVSAYARPLIRAVQRGSSSTRSLATTRAGALRIGAIRAHLDAYRMTQLRLLSRRIDRDNMLTHRAVMAAALGLGGCIFVIFLYGAYVVRAVVVPVRRVADMARRLGGGDLGVRVPETGAGETRALARTVNTMAGSLEETRDDLRLLIDEQSALRHVATLVAHGVSPTRLFDAVTAKTLELMGADSARLGRYEDDGSTTVLADHSERGAPLPVSTRLPYEAHSVTARVWHRGRPARRDDAASGTGALTTLARKRGLEHVVGAPIVVEGRLWGVINAYWSRAKSPPHNAESRMAQFAELVATAIANANSRDELVRSRARVLDAGDEARRRVVRDLHDGAQQRLVHTIVSLKLADRALSHDPTQAKPLLSEAITHAEQANLELRDLAHGILPSALTEGGLEPAVEAFASRLSVPVTVDVATPRLPAGIEASAYFVIAEGLTNVVKHSRAHRAEVSAHVKDRQLHLKIHDDGLGGARTDGAGLRGLEDRIVALGGELRVDSSLGAGTVIAATLPLPI